MSHRECVDADVADVWLRYSEFVENHVDFVNDLRPRSSADHQRILDVAMVQQLEQFVNHGRCTDCGWPQDGYCWCTSATYYEHYEYGENHHQEWEWTEEGARQLDRQQDLSNDALVKCTDGVSRLLTLLRWRLVRRGVVARAIVVFWMGEAMRTTCAEGGAGRRADAAAFTAAFG